MKISKKTFEKELADKPSREEKDKEEILKRFQKSFTFKKANVKNRLHIDNITKFEISQVTSKESVVIKSLNSKNKSQSSLKSIN